MLSSIVAILILLVSILTSLIIVLWPNRISELQAQSNEQQAPGQTGNNINSCDFDRDLFLSRTGDDVKCLQRYLNEEGLTLAQSGPGAPGNETNYFGHRTRAATARWQIANNILPALGYFGSISRNKYYKIKYAELVSKSVLLFGHPGPNNPGPGPNPTQIPIPTAPIPPIPTDLPIPPGLPIADSFGGKITSVKDCTCSRHRGTFIRVGPPIEIDAVFLPDESELVSGSLKEDRWTLGLVRRRFSICLIPDRLLGCFNPNIEAGQIIKIIGTE